MKVLTLLFLFTLGSLPAIAAPKAIATPSVVKTFLNNLGRLQQLSDDQSDEASRLNYENRDCFAGGVDEGNGVKINNSELFFLNISTRYGASPYCNTLFSLLYRERTLKMSHEILYTEAIYVPDINGKDEPYFYDTKVKKTCIYNNDKKVFWQEFLVDVSSGLIDTMTGYDKEPTDWRGGASSNHPIKPDNQNNQGRGGSSHLDQNNKPYAPPSQDIKPKTEQDLLRLAARYYTSKDYSAATSTLNTLTAKYPNNAEAWFRLALIVKYKTKWSKKVYKDPNRSAIEYMKKASDLANGKLKSKADNALFYWEHPDYM